jgi:signal transduction histidine kinase
VPLPEFLQVRDALLPGTSGVLTMLSALGPAFRELTLVQSLAFLLGLGAFVALGVGGLRAFAGRLRLSVFACIGATSAAVSLIVALGVIILDRIGLPAPDHVVIPGLIVGAVIGAGTASYCAVDERRSLTESHLLEAVQNLQSSVSRLRQQAWIGRRRVSYILHGSVQSALHAAALRLTANAHPDPELIAEIRQDISAAMAKLGTTSEVPTVLPDALAETADLWSEACTVRWNLSEEAQELAAQSVTTAECASEIVREGVGNAVRHGGATHVDVTIVAQFPRLVLVIADDGSAGHHEERKGLGSRMLDEMCVRWTRETDDRGTRLIAELAT